jgi:hypothetical protein
MEQEQGPEMRRQGIHPLDMAGTCLFLSEISVQLIRAAQARRPAN